jgi:hypothetical protein
LWNSFSGAFSEVSSQFPPNDATHANVLPIDQRAERRRPGRPKAIRRAPDAAERAQHERVRQRLHQHIAGDAVVEVTAQPVDRNSTAALDATMLEIAREAAGLGWSRERAVVEGRRDSEKIASRKIAALAKIGDLLLERARAGGEDRIDPHDERVQKVVAAFLEAMREAAVEVLDAALAEKFLAKFGELSRGWEERVGK